MTQRTNGGGDDERELEMTRNATVPWTDYAMAVAEIVRLRKVLRNTSIMAFTLCGVLLAALVAAWWTR